MRHCCLLSLCGAVLFLAGCGSSFIPVTGVVKLDGNPVEGATVTFSTEDGAQVCYGYTDAAGGFSLSQGAQPGALPGNYKVTVVKSPKGSGGSEPVTVGSPEHMKMMQKEMQANAKAQGQMSMPGKKTNTPVGPKSELPAVYASLGSTPLAVKVPSGGPVILELKGTP